jgi:hypothetical protein
MAILLKKQKSLYLSALKYIVLAFAVAIVGRLLLSFNVFITIATLAIFPIIFGKSGTFILGALGEYVVTRELKKLDNNYFIINDVNLAEAQIDHVLIGPKGIFTIETKAYVGKVYGNGSKRYWRQYVGKNKFGIKRYSPIKQGRGHSRKLYKLLFEKGFDRRIYTMVVFAGSAQVKVRPQPIPVLYRKEVKDYISELPNILSQEEVNRYRDEIMKLSNSKKGTTLSFPA